MSIATTWWEIDWYVCHADSEDVAFAKTEKRELKVGDELWRVARGIGPISIDSNHWAGHHLTGDPSDIYCAAAAPKLLTAATAVLNTWTGPHFGFDFEGEIEKRMKVLRQAVADALVGSDEDVKS